jgi:hypothetical protein
MIAAAIERLVSTDLPGGLAFKKPVKPRDEKYFAFSEVQISLMVRRPARQEGRCAIVTSVAAGCDGRVGRT